ncbi:MAG: hypothetical protein JXR68_13260 [Bacteroidales bacterium]|nr:hypothetical protein [Bacteroidales bacterium]
MKNLLLLFIVALSFSVNAQTLQADSYDGITRSNKQRIFLDNFDDNRYFWIKDASPSTHRISDGFLYFSNEYDFIYTDGKPISYDGNKNFEIETRIKFVSGDVEAYNGLMWGQLVFGEKYFFEFSSLGYFRIVKEDGFDEVAIKDATQTDVINKTGDNDLVIRKFDNKYYFFINKVLVHTMDYPGMPGQYLGFKVSPNSMIRINFLRLWYIN